MSPRSIWTTSAAEYASVRMSVPSLSLSSAAMPPPSVGVRKSLGASERRVPEDLAAAVEPQDARLRAARPRRRRAGEDEAAVVGACEPAGDVRAAPVEGPLPAR